jgi:hypothetical protein
MKLQLVADERISRTKGLELELRSATRALAMGDHGRSLRECASALRTCNERGSDVGALAYCAFRTLLALGELSLAAKFLGLSAALRDESHTLPEDADLDLTGECVTRLRQELGRSYESLFAEGWSLALPEAAELLATAGARLSRAAIH